MAELAYTITVTEELRPAIGIHGQRMLVHAARQSNHGLFICELRDGKLVECDEYDFRFLDSEEKFNELAWGE